MKTPALNELKKELEHKNKDELLSVCLRLAKFKKENKELLAFLLFEEGDISTYIENIKNETTEYFGGINNSNVYFIKKSLRKILRYVNKHIKFSLSKQAEAEILIHFCNNILEFSIPLHKSRQLLNMYEMQLNKIDLALSTLHPDLQYDLRKQLKKN
ncbi:hypothetical protein FW778_21985 [Ginsengibacter hankyongi]|uniref:Uncharacterized protein n=1 Tax=Ginsengibacter hankyongi TaxID=2607284 RepID=A0A5J5IDQ6_9BACT|nr:hypothetical protein [Ginsengibacter hankyongi]KAA9034508.1 hypothetical protein FW778_21985 [Ginsengibacter hankyongi]